MTWEQLCKLALGLPGVAIEPWYGTPALKVGGKGFVRLKEDGTSVVFILDSVDTQEALIAARPAIYFITDHYRGWPSVLARLSRLPRGEAMERLEHAWRRKASKAILAAHVAGQGPPEGKKTANRRARAPGARRPRR
jgi:hypothetical protein